MSKSLSAWVTELETRMHDVAGLWCRTLARTIACRPTRRRNAPRSYGLEQLEARQLLTANLGLAHAPIYDTPALQLSTSEVIKTLSAGEQNAGGKGTASAPALKNYVYSVVGNAGDATYVDGTTVKIVNPTSSGLALVGGGTDVDEAFRWMGAKANGGDFVVLRATGTGAYNSYIDALVPALDSVATLVISTVAGAYDSFVVQKIQEAEAIFIAGGDQADYINLWRNTPLEAAIYDALARHAPIGGTSAGLAVLSEFDFTAQGGTITSAEALANPYDSRVILDSGFVNDGDFDTAKSGQHSVLQYLDNLVTDSHFQQRDRMGRLITFMARIDQDPASDPFPRGIGINEQTALLVDEDGTARVVGNPIIVSRKLSAADQQRAVYLLSATATSIMSVNASGLTYKDILVAKADVGDTFNLDTWFAGSGVSTYHISAENGVLSSDQFVDKKLIY